MLRIFSSVFMFVCFNGFGRLVWLVDVVCFNFLVLVLVLGRILLLGLGRVLLLFCCWVVGWVICLVWLDWIVIFSLFLGFWCDWLVRGFGLCRWVMLGLFVVGFGDWIYGVCGCLLGWWLVVWCNLVCFWFWVVWICWSVCWGFWWCVCVFFWLVCGWFVVMLVWWYGWSVRVVLG